MARQKAYASAITAIEARKCRPTTHGLRSVSTVIPPITAWAGMPRAMPVASTNGRHGRVGARHSRRRWTSVAAQQLTATATSTKVSIRLPNSIAPWTPSSPRTT